MRRHPFLDVIAVSTCLVSLATVAGCAVTAGHAYPPATHALTLAIVGMRLSNRLNGSGYAVYPQDNHFRAWLAASVFRREPRIVPSRLG